MLTGSLLKVLKENENDTNSYYEQLYVIGGDDAMFWDNGLGAVVVIGYHECGFLITNKFLEKSRLNFSNIAVYEDLKEGAQRILNRQMMFSNDFNSRDRHKIWSDILNKTKNESFSSSSKNIAQSLLATVPKNTNIDFYNLIFRPYASKIIFNHLGLSSDSQKYLYPFVSAYAKFLDGKVFDNIGLNQSFYAIVSTYSYLNSNFLEKCPYGHDVEDWWADFLLTLVAGHESVAYLISNLLIYAGTQDSRLFKKQTSSLEIKQIISEALRIDSPVQLMGRVATNDVLINRNELKKGTKVYLHLGAANRDPKEFESPNEFNPFRKRKSNLAFGIHSEFCPGNLLAIQEVIDFFEVVKDNNCYLDVNLSKSSYNHGVSGRSFLALVGQLKEHKDFD